VGGPVDVHQPVDGSVTIEGPVDRTIDVGSDGTFSIWVPPGRYSLTGHSPLYGGGEYLCRGLTPVTVHMGQTTSTDVGCDMR
jgi:hypothetical protein